MKHSHIIIMVLAALLPNIVFCSPGTVMADSKKRHVTIAAMVYGSHNIVTLDGFKAGMKEKGYVDGENIAYIFDGPYTDKQEISGGMSKLVDKDPDLIFAATTPVTLAAKAATGKRKIPVVFGPVNDPVRAGVLKDLKKPGDNITGVMLTDSTAKQLEWALKIAPATRKIFMPYNPDDASSKLSFEKIKEAAEKFGLELRARETRSMKEIDELLGSFPDGFDMIFLPRDGMIMSRAEDFAKTAQEKKLVLSGTRLVMAERGALFGYGFDGFEIGRQMARLAVRILQGQNPGDLPVETAEDYLSINLKTANAIGLNITEHILRQAHIIIRPE